MTSPERQRLLEQLSHRAPARRSDQLHVLAEGPDAGAPVIVLVHPVGGGLLCYRGLVRALAREHRVVGVEAERDVLRRHDGQGLAALAATYVDLLAAESSSPPAVLCGWSHGGLIAWEMAQVMAGAESPSVVMVDTVWPHDPGEPLPSDAELSQLFVEDLARTNQLDPAGIDGVAQLAARLHLDDSLVDELSGMFVLSSRAFMRHSPTPGRSPLTLVAAEDTDTERLREIALAEVEVVRVEGVDHYSLLFTDQGVASVTEAVRASVRGAR